MNFLPDPPSAANFVLNSLDVLHDECPQAYTSLCALMHGREIWIHIDDEAIPLYFSQEEVSSLVGEARVKAGLQVRTSSQTILDLSDARLTLIDAVLESRLDLSGTAAELVLLNEAILTYLRGAVRCPSFPYLLDQFRDRYRLNHLVPIHSTDKLTTSPSATIISPT